jgi:hypothetical protein
VKPLLQTGTHAPALQLALLAFASPVVQMLPHPPQLAGSIFKSTHLPLHTVSPAGQAAAQEVPSQVTLPPLGDTQGVQELPQLSADESLLQVPAQSWLPLGQASGTQAPALQVALTPLIAQTLPHALQLAGSVCKSTQVLPHNARPAGQAVAHEVPSQATLPPLGAIHGVHKLPQLSADILLLQVPAQSWLPMGQASLAPASLAPASLAPASLFVCASGGAARPASSSLPTAIGSVWSIGTSPHTPVCALHVFASQLSLPTPSHSCL